MKTQTDILATMLSHVESECTKIDRESRFDDMLDECYSFDSIGGPFACMSPSRVLKECDPTAYRCGVNDYADGEEWVEINGDYYDQGEAEKAKEEFISDLESEASDVENYIEELEADAESENDDIAEKRDELAMIRAQIETCEKHSF